MTREKWEFRQGTTGSQEKSNRSLENSRKSIGSQRQLMAVNGSQEILWEYTEVRQTSEISASRTKLPPVSDPLHMTIVK